MSPIASGGSLLFMAMGASSVLSGGVSLFMALGMLSIVGGGVLRSATSWFSIRVCFSFLLVDLNVSFFFFFFKWLFSRFRGQACSTYKWAPYMLYMCRFPFHFRRCTYGYWVARAFMWRTTLI
jgi:hypothetical protein